MSSFDLTPILKLLFTVDPTEFFQGRKVTIDLVWDNITIQALFYVENGTVFVKGNFPRASNISADITLLLKQYDEQSVYFDLIKQMIPKGLYMVMTDYPVACEKHKKDLKDLNEQISNILNEKNVVNKQETMEKILNLCKEKKISKKKMKDIMDSSVKNIEEKMKSCVVIESTCKTNQGENGDYE